MPSQLRCRAAANHTDGTLAYDALMPVHGECRDEMTGPPQDPRDAWGLPPLGALEPVAHVDASAVRVIAPNAGPMTLDGTNTYLVGTPGGDAIIVDPGPDDPQHLAAVRRVIAARDVTVAGMFVTHRHADHAAAAVPWSRAFGVTVWAASRDGGGPEASLVGDGATISLPHLGTLDVVATPGHVDDHLALRLPSGALLTGDHVLGRGTSVISRRGGDLTDYLESLRKVYRLAAELLLPGHGPELAVDPSAVVDYYLEHRKYRLSQICSELGSGPLTVYDLVARLYPAVDDAVRPAASHSVSAALTHLARCGEVSIDTVDGLVSDESVARLQP